MAWLPALDRGGPSSAPLLVQARRDPERFADFHAERYDHVPAFFARRTLDPETGFELMAETFAAAYAGLSSLRGSSAGETYAQVTALALRRGAETSPVPIGDDGTFLVVRAGLGALHGSALRGRTADGAIIERIC